MFFSQRNLRALCILLSTAVLHACSAYSRVEIPVDVTSLTKQKAGVIVYRGIEYPIMKPRVRVDTLIFSRVNVRETDGTLAFLIAKDMRPSDRGYRVYVDSSYELLTDQPVLRVPERAIIKAEMDELNPLKVVGTIAVIVLSAVVILTQAERAFRM